MHNCLRIIFAGTPDFARRHLEALIRTQHQVVGVFTQPDRPTGRGKRLNASSVKQLAELHSLPLFQPYSLQQPEVQNLVAELKPDIMVVVAYGLILPQSVLELPRLGCINVHGSLLPRWRGSAPIQRALCAGDELTGVTIIQMDAGIDTGAMLHKVTCTIQPNDTSASLYEKISQIGPDALLFTLEQLTAGNATAEPQDNSLATYAEKLSKEEARINWHLPAVQLALYIRAFNPWPTSYFQLFGRPIKVWDANVSAQQNISCSPGTILAANKAGIDIATGAGVLTLTKLQLAGKQTMPVHVLLNAYRAWFIPGYILE